MAFCLQMKTNLEETWDVLKNLYSPDISERFPPWEGEDDVLPPVGLQDFRASLLVRNLPQGETLLQWVTQYADLEAVAGGPAPPPSIEIGVRTLAVIAATQQHHMATNLVLYISRSATMIIEYCLYEAICQ